MCLTVDKKGATTHQTQFISPAELTFNVTKAGAPPPHSTHSAFCPSKFLFLSVSTQAKATWKRQLCVNIYDVTSPCEQTFLPIHPSLQAYRESPPPGGGSGPYRKLRQERRVPLSFKVFVFPLTGGSPAVRAFHVSVPPLSFRDDFKAHFGSFVLPDVTAGPQKCPNRKM